MYDPSQQIEELNDPQRQLYWLHENGYEFKPQFDNSTQSWITVCIGSKVVNNEGFITPDPNIGQVSEVLQQIYDQAEIKVKESIVTIPKNNSLKRDRENDELAKEHINKKVVLPTNVYQLFADSANSTAILQRDSNEISNEIIITEVSNSQYSVMSNSQ